MSMPNIPNITPLISLDRCDSINLLLSSIALEEISLSHMLNAEGEKLQQFLKTESACIDDFIAINNSVNKTLKTVVKSQFLLVLKLEDVVEIVEQTQCYDLSKKGHKGKYKNQCKTKCYKGYSNCKCSQKNCCKHCLNCNNNQKLYCEKYPKCNNNCCKSCSKCENAKNKE